MEDKLLNKMFTEHWRWEQAIQHGVDKKLDKALLNLITTPEFISCLYTAISNDKNLAVVKVNGELKVIEVYGILPPRVQLIPKDEPGEFREVLICEDLDRVTLSVINTLFFEMFSDFVHKSCKSYQTGIGCGKVVKEVSDTIIKIKRKDKGKKYDMKKFFDSCSSKIINELFDKMELKYGKSKVIDLVRKFYNDNRLYDENGNLVEIFKSIKQGTATSSFIADAILYEIDKELYEMKDVNYWRYSDDILILSEHWEAADLLLKERLKEKDLMVNPKKEQIITKDKYFKFLGYSIRGTDISLSKTRIKDFQKEIEKRTLKSKKKNVVADVCNYLYRGNGKYSWATSVLSVVNVKEDIETLNEFVMDCIRAVLTGKKKVGGLGYETSKKLGVITRGIGKNVTANRLKTDKDIAGYKSLMCMRNALLTDRDLYNTFVRGM